MTKVKNLFIAGLLVFCSALGINAAFAEEILSSMTVSPPTQKIILSPGEKYEGALVISNSNDNKNDLTYSVSIGSFSENNGGDENNKDDYGTVDHITRTNYNQIMDWISLDKVGGTVSPNHTETLRYVIDVPQDAPAGGQYATIIVRDETNNNEGGDGNIAIQNIVQFASIIYAEVAGETRTEGEIASNDIPSFLLSSPLEATSMVKNNGNVHTDASYTLQVWPLFSDEEICTNEEEPETSLILPETERYHSQTCDLPSVGIFRAKQVVKIFGEESTVEKMVVICPLWLLFLIVFVIAALIIWLVMRIRAHKKDTRATAKSE